MRIESMDASKQLIERTLESRFIFKVNKRHFLFIIRKKHI